MSTVEPQKTGSHRRHVAAAVALCLLVPSVLSHAPSAGAQVQPASIAVGDAFVTGDSQQQVWTIGNARIELRLHLTSARTFVVGELRNPRTGRVFTGAADAESAIVVNGNPVSLGSAEWTLIDVTLAPSATGVRAGFTFRSASGTYNVVRWYACYAGAPAIETWTVVRATGPEQATVSAPAVWRVTIPATSFSYVQGLRAATGTEDDAFARRNVTVKTGEQLLLTETNRSTETYVPLVTGAVATDSFFGGLMWSGAWQMTAQNLGAATRVSASFPRLTTTVSAARPLETPHGVFGIAEGNGNAVSEAVRAFVVQGLREGRPFDPLVTYNTWYAYGTEIDAESVRGEIAVAAELGAELFVVDAGWYEGAGRGADFDSGLGTWRVDPARFPDGLAPLRDYAHELGLRFGIWVEPERVDARTIGRPGLVREEWLAKNNGSYGSNETPQVCLASDAARAYLMERLTVLLDDVRPDYLKWDNNLWVNCTRSGHGHGANDGNFRHVEGLYTMLAELRARYPGMEIEDCSQGGNRLDLGMMRYTDAAWMDDRTFPSVHVRHNLEGLMAIFPPAYLLSFAIGAVGEPLSADAPDLPLYTRSRMPGVFGLSYRASDLSDADRQALASEIALYKSFRDDLRDASGRLLREQASQSPPPWDVIQETSSASGNAIVFAFQNDPGMRSIIVQPEGLDRAAAYVIVAQDGSLVAAASGAALMDDGLQVDRTPETDAHLFTLRRMN